MSDFGERIREARKNQGLNQRELARKLSSRLGRRLSHDAIYSYEKNLRKPPADVLVALADILEVSVDYLTGRSNNPYGENMDEDDLQAVVSAVFRAQRELSPEEKKRLVNVLKAGWPELFREKDD